MKTDKDNVKLLRLSLAKVIGSTTLETAQNIAVKALRESEPNEPGQIANKTKLTYENGHLIIKDSDDNKLLHMYSFMYRQKQKEYIAINQGVSVCFDTESAAYIYFISEMLKLK